jgi:CubicO group peptidase (beta-lactamase class C family)
MRTRNAITWLIAILLAMILAADTAGLAGPAQPQVPSLDAVLEPIREAHHTPAMAAAVVRNGQTIALGAVGVRKQGSPEPVTIDDLWHIGSCTKSMAAVLAALLVEEGRWRWDMTLPEMFPECASQMQAEWRQVRLEHLLTHRGGAPHDLDANGLWDRVWERASQAPSDQRDYLTRELLTQWKPASPPGTKTTYSNAGYAIIGHAIELNLGRPWEQALRQRLCSPLSMGTVGFGSPGTAGQVDQPWGHQVSKEGLLTPVSPGLHADNPAAIAPGGGVHCTIGDFARYAAWQVEGARGHGTLLRPETFKRLQTPPGDSTYACGWVVARRSWGGGEVLTHGGSNTMFYAVIWLAPLRDFAVVACTNAGGDIGAKATDAAAAELIQRNLPDQGRPAGQ